MLASTTKKPLPWQTALMQAITNPQELLELLDLDINLLPAAKQAAALFPLLVTHGFAARMERGNPNDPLLQQVLPLGAECEMTPGYTLDPLQEANANPLPGVLHKYAGRVLLTFAGSCAINCRFCFRRHFPYAENNPGSAGWNKALDYIAQDPTIHEVILSGGDPLMATDKTLALLTDKLAHISHVKRLRIHSRIPIVLPERITPELIDWMTHLKQKLIMVVHCNHPQEIDASVEHAMALLKQANVVLLNQSLLLKGINDQVDILAKLSECLFEIDVQPYYLHVLDKVQGTAHFDLPYARAQHLYWQLLKRLPGYLVPKLTCEQPGAPSKTLLEPLEFCTA